MRYDPLIVDSSAQHVLHVYVSAVPCKYPRSPLPPSGAMYTPEPGGMLVANANQVELLDTYMQIKNISSEEASYLLSGKYQNYTPHTQRFGDHRYQVGIQEGRHSDRAEFYIKNCGTGTVRVLEVVLKEIAASGVPGDRPSHDRRGPTRGASAGRGSTRGRDDWGDGAAAPRGGGGHTSRRGDASRTQHAGAAAAGRGGGGYCVPFHGGC